MRMSRWHLVLAPMALIFALPLVWLTVSSFMTNAQINTFPPKIIPDGLHLDGYRYVFRTGDFGHWFLNSMFANKPDLMKKAGGPRIEIHADDAEPRQLSTGDRARVFNARGSFEAEVEVSDRVRPGVIASTKGYWLKHVRGGANVNATVEERDADMAGGAIFHDNRVDVERASVSGDALHQPRGQARVASERRAPAVGLRAR